MTVQTLLAPSRLREQAPVTSAAARNISRASCPQRERGGPLERILTPRPQQPPHPTTTHSRGQNRNCPSPRLQLRCDCVFSTPPQPQLTPREFAPAPHARPDWPHSPRNRQESRRH